MSTHAPEGVIVRHLEYLRTRNMRATTIYNRQRALARLAAWAAGPILYLPEEELKRWQHDRARQIQPEPLRTEMSHVRNFFRWAVRERYIDTDPTLRLELPRVARRLPRPIADAELAAAMAAADPEMTAILALAAFAGLRAIEIAKLDWAEVGIGQRRPHLRIVDGKGGHARLVPISSALIAVLAVLPHRRGPVIRRMDGYSWTDIGARLGITRQSAQQRYGEHPGDNYRRRSGADHHRWTETPSRAAVHIRLRKARGKAADFPCVKCGQPAKEWALQNFVGTLPDPQGPYSTNLDDYAPMCWPCHRRWDLDSLASGRG
jgi:site-specific recombinase XerD